MDFGLLALPLLERGSASVCRSIATVKATKSKGEPGLLRLDFEPRDEGVEPVDWEDFFEKFEEVGLVFLCQDHAADGKVSRFHKFSALARRDCSRLVFTC